MWWWLPSQMQASRTGTSNKLYRNNQICYPGTSTDNTGQVHQMYYTETSTTKYVIQGQVASEGKWTSLKRKYQAYIVCGFIWHKLWPHSQKCRLCDRFQVLSSPITLTTIDWSASGWKMILLHWWVGGWGVGQESVRVTIPTCLCGHCPNKHVFS